MSPAAASLLALLVAIVLSMTTRINVGTVAIALAWIVGVFVAHLSPGAIIRGFPAPLFLTLAGVTLLFALAETNGTLERLAQRAVRLAHGDARWLPLIFFVVASLVSSVGPGAVSSVALVAPLAIAVAARAGVPFFLTALMVTNGANAGNLSPVSAVGIIANTKMADAGLPGHEGTVWFANFAASALVALVAYLILGGLRLTGEIACGDAGRFTGRQRLTLGVLFAWIAGVVAFQLNVGLSAFAAAVLLVVWGVADETASVKRMPWSAILMVTGVTVLIALLESTGGMGLFTALLSRLATPSTVNGVMALITGAVSLYSSTSGVVLPAMLPTVPGLVQQLGGGDPLAVSLSINVGSSLVDVSPLSTLGALCVAAVPDSLAARTLFRQLIVWGFAMLAAGTIVCQLFAGLVARM